MATHTQVHSWTELIRIDGDRLLAEIRRLIAEGNVRRIIVRQSDQTVAEFPLTAGVAGALLAPWLAALGAIAALVTDCSIEVERVGRPSQARADEASDGGPTAPPVS
jgi:hypothetical protein